MNGTCTIPSDVVALSLNVTAANPTAGSFLTVFPADVPRPLASNLNWTAGQAAVPNAVTTGVSSDGRVSFYNNAGSVDIIADIVGYYVDHTHDDRYYTKSQMDSALSKKVDKPNDASMLRIQATTFTAASSDTTYVINAQSGGLLPTSPSQECFTHEVLLPSGATIQSLSASVSDSGAADALIRLWRYVAGANAGLVLAVLATSGSDPFQQGWSTSAIQPELVEPSLGYVLELCGTSDHIFYSAAINYKNP